MDVDNKSIRIVSKDRSFLEIPLFSLTVGLFFPGKGLEGNGLGSGRLFCKGSSIEGFDGAEETAGWVGSGFPGKYM